MKRIILPALILLFAGQIALFAQEDPKEVFEKSWNTESDSERVQLREMIEETYPGTEYGLFCKGWLMIQKDEYRPSLEYLDKAISMNDKFWQAYHIRANVHGMLGDKGKAIEDLSSVISLNPSYADAYYVRGAIYYYEGDKVKGCSDISRASELGSVKAEDLKKKLCK